MTLFEMLCYLRERLLEAQAKYDQQTLMSLSTTFSYLLDSAYHHEDQKLGMILEELENAARDFSMGVDWKANIPSIEDLRSAILPSD